MNWDEYSKMMDEKIHEAELNMKYAEQKFREAKNPVAKFSKASGSRPSSEFL